MGERFEESRSSFQPLPIVVGHRSSKVVPDRLIVIVGYYANIMLTLLAKLPIIVAISMTHVNAIIKEPL